MRFYSLNQISPNEKRDILNKHTEVYNGYRTMQSQVPSKQPLYIYDSAGDKQGITVTNKGNVKGYTNYGINESKEYEEGIHDYSDLNLSNDFDYVEKELEEVNPESLQKGKKYKFKSPSFEDEVEYLGKNEFDTGEPHHSFRGKDEMWHSIGEKGLDWFIHDLDNESEKVYEPMESAFHDELEEIEGPLYSEVDPAYNFISKGPQSESMDEKKDEGSNIKHHKLTDYGEKDTAFSKMKRGHKPEDVDWEDIETVFTKYKKGKGDVQDIEWEEIDEDLMEALIKQKIKINEMFNRFDKYN